MLDPIHSTIQRTQRYWYVDGVSEIAVGAVLLLMAAFYLLLGLAEPGSVPALVVGIGQPVIIIAGWWVSSKAVKAVKERLTYPRTGYVAYPQKKGSKRAGQLVLNMVIAASVALLITFLASRIGKNLLPVISAALIALAIAYMAYRIGLVRFYLLSAYTLLAGLLAAWLNLPDPFTTALFFGLFALGWVVSGAAALIHYLRSTQPAVEEQA